MVSTTFPRRFFFVFMQVGTFRPGEVVSWDYWNVPGTQTSTLTWLFQLDDSKPLLGKWLFHIKKWLFRVRGMYQLRFKKLSLTVRPLKSYQNPIGNRIVFLSHHFSGASSVKLQGCMYQVRIYLETNGCWFPWSDRGPVMKKIGDILTSVIPDHQCQRSKKITIHATVQDYSAYLGGLGPFVAGTQSRNVHCSFIWCGGFYFPARWCFKDCLFVPQHFGKWSNSQKNVWTSWWFYHQLD